MSGHHGELTKLFVLILISIAVLSFSNALVKPKPIMLFSFQNSSNLSNWSEASDKGKSESTFYLYKTEYTQYGILYSVLKPIKPRKGVAKLCYTGVQTNVQFDLDKYRSIFFTCKAYGNASWYKIVLNHNNSKDPTFEQSFKVKHNKKTRVSLQLYKFKPFSNLKLVENGPSLNTQNITSFGIKVVAEVNKRVNQSDSSSIMFEEIWARA